MKHGWEFMDALTLAIEAWSADIARRDPHAFHYREADLRHAVERDLFFSVTNDVAVQAWFDARIDGAALPPVPQNPFYAMIAPYLMPHASAASPAASTIMPPVGAARWLRSETANLLRLGRQPFHTARIAGKTDFLFLVIHPKFVEFFRPIAAEIGADAAYLCVDDPSLEAYLTSGGLPSVALHHAFSRPPSPRGVMRNFLRLCRIFDRMVDMLEALRPRVILVPEGNAPVYEIALRAGQTRGIATICLQHGAHGYTNPGFRNWHFNDVFAWGARFVTPFAHHNPGQHFTITGTPVTMSAPARREDDASIRSIGFFLSKGATIIRAAEWHDLLQFIGWTAATFPDIEIVVRDHPSLPSLTMEEHALVGDPPNLRFMPPRKFSLNDVLGSCDMAVAAASTTLLEAIATGAIPFVFGTFYPKDFPDITGEGAAVAAHTIEEAKTALSNVIEHGHLRAGLRANGARLSPELFAAQGPAGVARISDALRAAADRERQLG
jgi:hypothetical protein